MLGGKESFREGGFNRTPIGQMLPVYMDRLPQPETGTKIHFNLTREGWLQAWARLRDNEQEEQQRLSEMPAFRVLNRLGAVKPGARVVATVGDDPDRQYLVLGLHEALISQIGRGNVAVLARTSVLQYQDADQRTKDICHDLEVEAVVESSLFCVGDFAGMEWEDIKAVTES